MNRQRSHFSNGLRYVTLACATALFLLNQHAGAQSINGRNFPRKNIVRAQSKAIDLHGPFDLTADALLRKPQSKRAEILTEDEVTIKPAPCRTCSVGGAPEPGGVPQTPPTTGKPWLAAASLGGLDPQVAAGKTYLVVTTGTQIAFYDKAGQLLTGPNNAPVSPLYVGTFFKELVPDMNNYLNLPAGADLSTYQLSKFYDARTIYDPFRHRFFIVALASNSASTGPLDSNGNPTPTKIDRASRRTKMMAAVSVSEDPRDGWYLYWWNAVIDDGVCNDPDQKTCAGTYNQPGDAGDYPCPGISDRFFMVSDHVGWYDPQQPANGNQERYAVVHVLPADSLAGLAPPSPNWAYWDIRFPDQNSVVRYSLQPAVHHTVDPLGFAFLADNTLSNGSKNTLVVLGFSYLEGSFAPPLRAIGVPVQPFQPAADAPQRDADLVGNTKLKLDNIAFFTQKAAYRDNKLYVAWPDCRDWLASGTCQDANRLVRLDTSQFVFNQIPITPASGFIDRTFGWRNPIDDPPSELAYYGLPAVEVNKNGDMVVVYVRSSSNLYPQARYSVYFGNDVDILPSRILKLGEGPLDKTNQTDHGGASVDPYDDTAVWIAHSYASGANPPASQRVVVGKVFGTLHPDLTITQVSFNPPAAKRGTAVDVHVTVRNQGDGPTSTCGLNVYLHAPGNRKPLLFATTDLPAVKSGKNISVTLTGTVPSEPRVKSYSVESVVDVNNRVEEYNEANNTATAEMPLRVLGR